MAEAEITTSRWQTWASLAGIVIPILVFSAWIGTLQAGTSVVNQKLSDDDARIERLTDTVNTNRAQLAQVCSALVEVETQFRASDQVRNLMHTNDLRIQAMLWHKAYAADYPVGDPYLPTIAQDQPSPCR
jgi:hypothetical protein